MKITYFGHSAFQIQTNGTTILFDPFITGNPHTKGVVTAADLEPDVILLTHAHSDHWGDTPDIAVRSGAQVVSNFEVVTYLSKKHGHDNVRAMNTGGAYAFPWGKVTQTYARHSSSFPDGTYGGNPTGFILETEGKTIYNTGDTDIFTEMERIGRQYDIDAVLLPIGDCFTMGIETSVDAARMIGPGLAIPLHYNTMPEIEIDTSEWAREMVSAGMQPKIMNPGETLDL